MAARARKTNWFAIWVSVAAVVVLVVVAGIVVWMNNAATAPGEAPQASNIDADTGAIAFGDGDGTMDTYIDFMCPNCNSFEQTYGSEIEALKDDGTITLNIHPIAILDSRSQGTQFSSRAASAMYSISVHDPDHALAFMQAMFTNQPEEGSTGLTDDQIISIAESAGVTVSEDLKKDITSGRYISYVQTMTDKTPISPGSTTIGTPTVAIDGEVISLSQLPADPADLGTLFTG